VRRGRGGIAARMMIGRSRIEAIVMERCL